MLPPQLAVLAEKVTLLHLAPLVSLPQAFGVLPLLTQAELGKAATSKGSSYIEVELSRTKTMLGSCPDCEAKKVTSPRSSVVTEVGCTRLSTAALARQSPGLQLEPPAEAGRGASTATSSRTTVISSAGRRSWRSRMLVLTVRTSA